MSDRQKSENDSGLVYSNKLTASLVIISTVIFLIVWLAPYQYSHYHVKHFVAWHTLAECFSVAVSVSIFSIMWYAQVADETRYRLNIVSIAFLAVAILDAAHMLSFYGMPSWITQPGQGKGVPFWIFARYAAIFALIVLVAPTYKRLKFAIPVKPLFVAGAVYTAIPFVIVLLSSAEGNLFFVPGQGLTGLKIGLEWGVVALLVLALIINNYTRRDAKFYDTGAVILAIHLSILSELCFTLYSNVSGVFSVLGHVFKIGSYIFLYRGIAVTSLKLPFTEMAKNQELLEQITTNIKQIFLITSFDRSAIYYVSPGFDEITGKHHLSLLNKPKIWFELIHPDDRENVHSRFRQQAGSRFTHEFRMLDANGEMMYMLESIYPILDEKNKSNRIASVCEDITNKKLLQQALSDSERMLSNMIDSLPILVGYWGSDLRNIFANEAYALWFRESPDHIRGMYLEDLLGKDMFALNKPYIEAVLNGVPQEFERDMADISGKIRHTLFNYIPDFRSGHVVGFFVTVLDVTTLKETNNELRASEDRLLRSQSLGHIGSWEINLRTGEAWWSQENYGVYGIQNGTPIDMHTALDMVHPDDRDDLVSVWESSLLNQSTYSHEHRITTPGNETKYVWEFAEISYDEAQNPYLMAGCTQNITERKVAELERASLHNQLMQSQKMESIGHLTGGVAHDFNNMLGAMLGYTELLRQVLPATGEDADRTDKYISEILTAGNRAKELISQMLVFSRYSPDTQQETPVILIKPIIKEVVNLLRSSIPATISINYHMSEDMLRAQIHPVQLHQILLNLAINARDAIQEYGKIDISMRQAFKEGYCNSCHLDYIGEYIEIIVRDDGDGVPKDVIDRIFDPFYTTKEVGKGTGMGLSVVHGIVHSVGGHINLNSEEGKGSEFCILLPATDSISNSESSDMKIAGSNSERKHLYGMSIMVVDDELSITSLLTDLLELHGAIVNSFNRSSDALTDFMGRPDYYELIITDETMPELSGIDMSVTMLKKRPRLPIILCTGYSNKVDREMATENGISGFMLKPINASELIEEIIKIKNL